jgi:hypothetical protein
MTLTELLGQEPCKRRSGSYRAYFATKEEAEAFAANPANTDYHGDIAHHCPKCLRWHLSRVEWLVQPQDRVMRTVN